MQLLGLQVSVRTVREPLLLSLVLISREVYKLAGSTDHMQPQLVIDEVHTRALYMKALACACAVHYPSQLLC